MDSATNPLFCLTYFPLRATATQWVFKTIKRVAPTSLGNIPAGASLQTIDTYGGTVQGAAGGLSVGTMITNGCEL